MATHLAPSTTRASQTRPLLGLRCMPGRLALAAFRMPLFLYRGGWGWMLGRTFLLLVHVGRRTGEPHDTVAMVLGDDADTGELVICSAWGPEADWVRNLQAGPGREVRVGRQRFVPEHCFLSEDEAVAVGVAFRRVIRTGCGCSAPSSVGETCGATTPSTTSSEPTRSSRSDRRGHRKDLR